MTPKTADEIRAELKALRNALTPEDANRLGRDVTRRFLAALPAEALKKKLGGRSVALYQALPGELELTPLSDELSARGVPICYPRIVDSNTHVMEFVAESEGGWKTGPYGIREPQSHAPALNPAQIGLLIVPGVAFGLHGERIGRGAGFYDRFLARIPDAIKVALAFDFQVRDGLPQAAWDQGMDWVLTESREYRGPRIEKILL